MVPASPAARIPERGTVHKGQHLDSERYLRGTVSLTDRQLCTWVAKKARKA